MSRRIFALLCLSLPLISTGCMKKTSSADNEAAIQQWLDTFKAAYMAKDVNKVMSLYAPDVVAYDVVAPLQIVGKDAYTKDNADFLASYQGTPMVEFRDLHIVAGDDVAFAMGLQHLVATVKGQKIDVWSRFTSGFRKENGVWLDVHDHVSMPVDLDTGKALMDLNP